MTNRDKKIVLVLLAAMACVSGFGFVHNKLVKPNVLVKSRTKRIRSIYVLGDSQVARTLGDAYHAAYAAEDIWVDWFGKPGATPSDYLKDPTLFDEFNKAMKSIGCFDVLVVQLGDNGIQTSTEVSQFRELIKTSCPHTLMVWSGPMKAVNPTNGSSTYVSSDPTSPRYLPTYNNTRAIWNERILKGLTEQDLFINNMELQTNQKSGSFTDKRTGDGIHLTEASAADLVNLHKPMIERFWQSYERLES